MATWPPASATVLAYRHAAGPSPITIESYVSRMANLGKGPGEERRVGRLSSIDQPRTGQAIAEVGNGGGQVPPVAGDKAYRADCRAKVKQVRRFLITLLPARRCNR